MEMNDALLFYFVGVAVACLLNAVSLYLAVRQSSTAAVCYNYEWKYRGFKHGRMYTYGVLVLLQLGLSVARLATHWQGFSWIDSAQLLVLLLYVITLAVLYSKWPSQLSLKLSGVLLLALLEPGLLFAEDVTVVQPGGALDAEHIARVVVHGLQLVLLVGLLISEVIIQQHQLLQRSSFDDTYAHANGAAGSRNGVAGGSGARGSPHRYQRLPGFDMEGGKQQPAAHLWHPGDSRWHMAASAFHYVWPTTGILRARLAACFVLVMAERAINLAAPIAFKHMVEVLSNLSTAAADSSTTAGGPLAAAHSGLRMLLMSLSSQGSSSIAPAVFAAGTQHAAAAAAAAGAAASNLTAVGSAAAAAAAGGAGAAGAVQLLAPFWVLFYPWVFIYLGAFFLRGGSGSEGLLANIRDLLWIPITQAAFCRISCDVFGHLLALDLNFHVHRKTGQIMRILDRGTSSIQDVVSIVLFNVLPQMVDIVVACTYLAARMQPWVAVIVLITVSSYVPLTVCITERRGKVRKVMNALDNERESRATDVLLNYETVKYFCNESFELAGYDRATRQYQAAEYWQLAFLSLLSMVQSMIVWVGLAAGLVVCVWGSSRGSLTVGDTVLFITMMQQLYVPLTYFGSYYRQVQKALIDMENMFELLATTPAVQDEPGARTLRVTEGRVDFKEVVFSYHPNIGQPVLKGVSFTAPGGKTLAVVGSTGSGKSTLLRLLLRFYDPQSGAVLIDGQDIKHCRQSSVRAALAVVPQDTVLFNETIMYNIRYGKTTATDNQVHEAAEIGHIHEHLMRFPHGYNTRVGERGLRLSGGEKQRVAFARAVLKGPAILVLDEATSALDSLTEKLVQDSLAKIKGRCTQLIVAHRLSTVMDADQILVLDRGQVAEQGSHAELIEKGGLYCSMWARQQDHSVSLTPAASSPDLPAAAAAAAAGQRQQCSSSSGSFMTTPSPRGIAAGLPTRQQQQQQQLRGRRVPVQLMLQQEPGEGHGNDYEGKEENDRNSSSGRLGRVGHVGRSLADASSIRRYQMLRRVDTGTSDAEFISEAPSPEQEPDENDGARFGHRPDGSNNTIIAAASAAAAADVPAGNSRQEAAGVSVQQQGQQGQQQQQQQCSAGASDGRSPFSN